MPSPVEERIMTVDHVQRTSNAAHETMVVVQDGRGQYQGTDSYCIAITDTHVFERGFYPDNHDDTVKENAERRAVKSQLKSADG